jgi:hypothetical protein
MSTANGKKIEDPTNIIKLAPIPFFQRDEFPFSWLETKVQSIQITIQTIKHFENVLCLAQSCLQKVTFLRVERRIAGIVFFTYRAMEVRR